MLTNQYYNNIRHIEIWIENDDNTVIPRLMSHLMNLKRRHSRHDCIVIMPTVWPRPHERKKHAIFTALFDSVFY